jgi:hypothetical protein
LVFYKKKSALTFSQHMYSTYRNKLSNDAQTENASSVLSYSAGSACGGRAERNVMAINPVFRRL